VALAKEGMDVTLVYCFEKAGVLRDADDERTVIPVITRPDYERYVSDGTISGGMMPKVSNALDAVAEGVSRVVITKAECVGDEGTGTVITNVK